MNDKFITDFLDEAEKAVPEKIAVVDRLGTMTYRQLKNAALKVASAIIKCREENPSLVNEKEPEPVATLMETGNNLAAVFHGILYAGNYYSCMDENMPNERIEKIFKDFQPVIVITDKANLEKAESLNYDGIILIYENILENTEIEDIAKLKSFDDEIPTRLCSIIFTSGSTGTPKGVIAGNNEMFLESMINKNALEMTSEDHVGNQSPLYYAIGNMNLYASIKSQATCYFIPKTLFSEPAGLIEYIILNKISVLGWSVSGLALISRFDAWEGYEEELMKNLRVILFAGEVAPTKLIMKMMRALPTIKYKQIYGATEYFYAYKYEIDRCFEDDERIPIGFPMEGINGYILKEDGSLAGRGESGQICLSGPGMSLGYYNDPEKTESKFKEDPFHPEKKMFCTGDMAEINERGEAVFKSRTDFMIKMMGHRIELGEIEMAAASLDGKSECACVFDEAKEHIIMIYSGTLEKKQLREKLKEKLPQHMIPKKIIKVDRLPLNPHNKIDRMKLKEEYT